MRAATPPSHPTAPSDAAVSLRRARHLRGMTQAGLARRLGISESYYHVVERGLRCPSLEIRARIFAWMAEHGLEALFRFCLALTWLSCTDGR